MSDHKISKQDYEEIATGVKLTSHIVSCADRRINTMSTIQEMKAELKLLRQDVSMAKGGLKVALAVITIIAGVLVFNFQ